MKREAWEFLRGRRGGELTLEVFHEVPERVLEGALVEEDGYWYPIIDGLPFMLRGSLREDYGNFATRHGLPAVEEGGAPTEAAIEQEKTSTTFSDKWRRFRRYGLEASHQEFLLDWYCKKLGVADVSALQSFYREKSGILEVGPGSGFNSKFMAESTSGDVFAVDISEAARTTYENTRDLASCHVVRADLMEAPFADEFFDFIIADGVLHHTPDTHAAVRSLVEKLAPSGQMFFYVYRKMGAARYFSDQHLRGLMKQMSPEECYEACRGLTELGRELSHLNVEIDLEVGISALGIPPGRHDVQRLLYYNFLKCFWNDAFDFETNNMVNFDWYHPNSAWQHSEDEVGGWLEGLGIREYVFNASNPNGISVLLRKPG